jgi:dTDP-4-amino-4,6-dideoxygalactose transaminase
MKRTITCFPEEIPLKYIQRYLQRYVLEHILSRFLTWPPEKTWLQPNDFIYNSCRCAIYQYLFHVNKAHPHLTTKPLALIPSLHCRSQVEAPLAANYTTAFYRVNRDLTVNEADVLQYVQGHSGLVVLCLVHYYGFPPAGLDIQHLLKYTHHPLFILEDGAHALFSPIGHVGDASVYSLSKSLPVRDGGILRLRHDHLPIGLQPTPSPWSFAAQLNPVIKAMLKATPLYTIRSLIKTTLTKILAARNTTETQQNEYVEPIFTAAHANAPAAPLTHVVISQLYEAATHVRESRQRNFTYLAQHVSNRPNIQPLFASYPNEFQMGVSPLAFPIITSNRNRLESRLADEGIITFAFGREPHKSLNVHDFPETQWLMDHTLALPCHQDLSQADMQGIATAVIRSI